MKNSRRNKSAQIFIQWITACIIIVAMLMIMFVVINMSNQPLTLPSNPDTGSTLSPVQTSFPEGSTTLPQTTSTASESAATTTITTTTVSNTLTTTNMCRITAEFANIRTGPGASYEYVQQVFNGESYVVLGQSDATNGISWYQIDLGEGKSGYVCSAFVECNKVLTGGEAYLTFDDGPSHNTTKILDILDQYGVKATFFVIYNKGQEDVYRDIVNRGHTIALHSYTHDYKGIYSSKDAFFNDLTKLSDYVESITGVKPTITRFPGGSSNTISKKYCEGIMTELTREVEARGYYYFDWNVDSGDADDVTVDKDILVNNIRTRMGSYAKAFILMHDAKSKTTTVDALPDIIEFLLSRGYKILPITESTPPMHHKVNN